VLAAASFDEAKHLIDTASPDLLIIDVRLGPYNGLHLVIRQKLSRPDRPIIITTAFADEVLAREAKSYGAEFVQKPFDIQELLALIKRLLPDDVPADSGDKTAASNTDKAAASSTDEAAASSADTIAAGSADGIPANSV
jgi:DNA-binding response OmpR family regulator